METKIEELRDEYEEHLGNLNKQLNNARSSKYKNNIISWISCYEEFIDKLTEILQEEKDTKTQ